MLHTDIQKHLQELSLEDTLALAQLALEQVKKKAKSNPRKMPDNQEKRKKALKKLSGHIKKLNLRLPHDFKFDREEANARR